MHDLPEHLLNLRKLILHPRASAVIEEQENAQAVKSLLLVESGFEARSYMTARTNTPTRGQLRALHLSTKFEISRWLRQVLTYQITTIRKDVTEKTTRVSSMLDLKAFKTMYRTLEDLEDFDVMADVLGIFIEFSDQSLLNSITETINLHFEVLYAVGATDDLFQGLLQRLAELTTRSTDEKPFLLALVDLAQRLPRTRRMLLALRKELALCEPKLALAACSPVSESMAEALQNTGSDFLDEVELLFTSGTSMDKPLFSRIFTDIMNKVEAAWLGRDETAHVLVELLSRLRHFNCEAFDSLIFGWLDKMLCSARCPPIDLMLPPLVCSGIINLQTVFELFLIPQNGAVSGGIRQVADLLDLCICHTYDLEIPRSYRFLSETRLLARKNPDLVIVMIDKVVNQATINNQAAQIRACNVMSKPGFMNLVQEIVVASSTASISLQKTLSQSSYALIAVDVIDHALGLERHDGEDILSYYYYIAT